MTGLDGDGQQLDALALPPRRPTVPQGLDGQAPAPEQPTGHGEGGGGAVVPEERPVQPPDVTRAGTKPTTRPSASATKRNESGDREIRR